MLDPSASPVPGYYRAPDPGKRAASRAYRTPALVGSAVSESAAGRDFWDVSGTSASRGGDRGNGRRATTRRTDDSAHPPPAGVPPCGHVPPRTTTRPPTRFDDHLAAQLLIQRIVFLGTQVDEVSANRVCAQLLLLSAEDPRPTSVSASTVRADR